MRPIEKYVEAMENKDFAGLAELFTEGGILCDYCTTSASQQEYHIYGKEAINMFFRNKFGFRRYSILDAEVVMTSRQNSLPILVATTSWLSPRSVRPMKTVGSKD